MTQDQKKTPEVIEAAGGLLWRTTAIGLEIAIIHRPRYNDWTLPKGKREPGESWQETALREVYEETCCRIKLGNFAGGQVYTVEGIPKVVLYWHMYLLEDSGFTPHTEVDQLVWMTLDEALGIMSYESEKALLA